MQTIQALDLLDSEKIFFSRISHYKHVADNHTSGLACMDPRNIAGRTIKEDYFGSILPNLKSHRKGLSSRNRGMAHPISH